MDSLRANYRDDDDDDDEDEEWSKTDLNNQAQPSATATATAIPPSENDPLVDIKEEQYLSEELSEDELSDDEIDDEDAHTEPQEQPKPQKSQKPFTISDEDDDNLPSKKHKPLSSFISQPFESISQEQAAAETTPSILPPLTATTGTKKSKKKNNVWTKSTSRKGKKKSKPSNHQTPTEETVLITPVPRYPDKSDDSPDMNICLSKVYKAEKVELSDDRLSAGSSKGYRMVRATRGVIEGTWYFEIRVTHLGETGHTRLGWSTEKGDLQAPVGYDGNSFGFRDIDGSKVHKALREKYAEDGYVEGDVIGCYINLPEGELYAPKAPYLVWYKGQRYARAADGKEDPPKVVPGSEISFFKNGVCQGVAFKDLYGGRYYPAASMYTLPNQSNCVVQFNFGPDFEFFPQDFDGRPMPRPMIEVPYHSFDGIAKNDTSAAEKKH